MRYLIIFAIIEFLDPFLYCKERIHRISSPKAGSIRVAAVMHDLKHVRLAYCPNLAIVEQRALHLPSRCKLWNERFVVPTST